MCALFTLDAPVLPCLGSADVTAGPALGAPACAFPQLFQPVPVPEVALKPTFVPEGCGPVSLEALMAQDLVLEDDWLVLPPMMLDARAGQAAEHAGESTRCGCCQPALPGMHLQQHGLAVGQAQNDTSFKAGCLQALHCHRSSGRAVDASRPAQGT